MKTNLLSFLLLMILLASCEKEAGEGGTSVIRGKVVVREYNVDYTDFRGEYPGAKEDVFIIYGDEVVYGDKFETSYDGTYEFSYLQKGKYTVFAYTKDSVPPFTNMRIPVIREVEITAKNQVVDVPVIKIVK